MEWLNFRHLYAFWMVARAGSFTRAAAQMRVAQSAVSSQVAALEEYVEQQLLVRAHRSVELTPAGRALLGHASSIFAQSRAINALIENKDTLGGHSTLRVGVVGGASRNFVFRLLSAHIDATTGVSLSISSGSYSELYALLRRFQLDAIVSLDLPKKKDMAEVSYRRLGESELCVAGTPALIRKLKRRRVKRMSIDVYKFRHPFEVDVLSKHVQPQLGCDLSLRMDTDDIPLLRFFANSGKGIAVLPRVGVLEDLEAGNVDAITIHSCPEVIIYGMTMSNTHSASPGSTLFPLWPHDA